MLCAGESTGYTGHRQAGLLRVELPIPPRGEVSISSVHVAPTSSQESQACPLQRAEAFGYQLAKMVQVAVRKKHTGVRHQRWLLQRDGGTTEIMSLCRRFPAQSSRVWGLLGKGLETDFGGHQGFIFWPGKWHLFI